MLRISSATRASTSSRSGSRAGVGSTGKLEAVYRLSDGSSITKNTKSAETRKKRWKDPRAYWCLDSSLRIDSMLWISCGRSVVAVVQTSATSIAS